MSATFFAGMMAMICLLLLGTAWTLHADYEQGARRVCFVLALIVGVTALGALLGPHWR
jgi:hypothetical protein